MLRSLIISKLDSLMLYAASCKDGILKDLFIRCKIKGKYSVMG